MKNLIFILSLIFTISANAQVFEFDWAKSFGGAGGDNGESIIIDDAGNLYITGFYTNEVDFDPNEGVFNLTSVGAADGFVQKLDKFGNLIWAKSFGGSLHDSPADISFDNEGNLVIVGNFMATVDFDPGPGVEPLTAYGDRDIFILKLTSDGEFTWVKSANGAVADAFGGASSVEVDNDGNIYVSGHYRETIDFDPGGGVFNLSSNGDLDVYVLKLNESGEFLWAQSFGSTSNERVYGMVVDIDGSVYLSGGFENTIDFDPGPATFNLTSEGLSDIFLLKLNSEGNFEWVKNIGGDLDDFGREVLLDNDDNIMSLGVFNDTVDFDLGADVFKLASNGSFDCYVSKLSPTGEFIWAKSFGGTSTDYGFALLLDNENNIYTCGYYADTVDFDPGPGSFEIESKGGQDGFILCLKENGDFAWATTVNGTGFHSCRSLAFDIVQTILKITKP